MLIDADDLVIGRRIHLQKGFGRRNAGIVEDAVERAEGRHGEFDHGLDLGGIGDIDLEGFGFDAKPGRLCRHSLGAGLVEIGDDQVGALGRKGEGGFFTDAAGAAGDDNDLVLQFHSLRSTYPPSRHGARTRRK